MSDDPKHVISPGLSTARKPSKFSVLDKWRRANNRVARLQRMFDDRAKMDEILRKGRYLRLCAAVAKAQQAAERALAELKEERVVGGDQP